MKRQGKQLNAVMLSIVTGIFFVMPAGAMAGTASLALPVPGQSAMNVPAFSGAEYGTRAPLFEDALSRAGSYQDKLQVVRDYVQSGRYAGKGRLENMFKKFGPGYRINLNDPGVVKDLKLLGSKNPQVVQGAARELVFYQKLYNSPYFTDVSIGAPVPTARGGISDQDITFTSKLTGKKTWVEVKDVRNLKLDTRIKAQIDRMAEAKDFQSKMLINRKGVDPAVKAYAEQRGIEVIDNVRSEDLIEDIMRVERKILSAKKQIAAGSFQTAFGAWLVVSQGWQAYRAFNNNQLAPGERGRLVASKGSLTVTGAAVTGKGVCNIMLGKQALQKLDAAGAQSAASTAPQAATPLAKYSKVLGPIAWVGLGAYAGFEANRWREGDINTRQLTHTGTSLTGGVGGAMAGGKVGAKFGAGVGIVLGPKGAIVGSVVGGVGAGVAGAFGGSFAAAWAGDMAYDYFRMSNDELNKGKIEALWASL